MTREQTRSLFVCRDCGAEALRWEGRCPACGEWNTLEEAPRPTARGGGAWQSGALASEPRELSDVALDDFPRLPFHVEEANRVLGGGLVPGSLVLIGGDPGVGKSTLLLQLAAGLAERAGPALYVSGEESTQQIKLRADRLGLSGKGLHVLAETDMAAVLHHLDRLTPTLAVIDSIQSVAFADQPAGAGSIAQVRECGLALLRKSKAAGAPILVTGHVTKDGNLAGPRTLEHMVDVVLYLEGGSLGAYRTLRGEKNRFGATDEVGVFEMGDAGLVEVPNPSEAALSSRQPNAIGSVVAPVMEGTRPMLVEIQALATPSTLPAPRRVANGVDMGRLLMIIAVLVKRAGVNLGGQDIIVNVAGGFRASEPAVDLGIALALASSLQNRPLPETASALGEIGLGGELRSASQAPRRLAELGRMGFESCIGPRSAFASAPPPAGVTPLGAASVGEALELAFAPQPGGER